MTVRIGSSITQRVRGALQIADANPDTIAAIRAEDEARAKAAAKEEKRLVEARAKVDNALPGRVEALIESYITHEQDALRLAAERLARAQLERQYGIVAPQVAAAMPAPPRLTRSAIDRAWK